MTLRTAINPYGAIGFAFASFFAVTQDWSLPEFCWTTWLAGLMYAWGCIATAVFQIILSPQANKTFAGERLAFLRKLPPNWRSVLFAAAAVAAAIVSFQLYSYLFGFYGLFLSVFAEMEPASLFGRNGFINSDFYTPLFYLLERYWPMAAGVLIMNWQDYTGPDPWKRILLPMQKEILRIHLMILALPFFCLAAWALFRHSYQSITIVLLMGLFYLLPKNSEKKRQPDSN